MNYLLDTCVISELVSRQPAQRVLAWIESTAETRLYLSVLTIGEIRKGIERLPDSRRRTEVEDWLYTQLLPRFRDRLLPVDVHVALRWGELVGRLGKMGKVVSAMDSLIAATALQAGLVVVTRNGTDFADTGVQILDPWHPSD